MEKYGFVYKWIDDAHSRTDEKKDKLKFYIGCHWGHDFDGYICSSNWMRNSYRKRPQDFTRIILVTNISTKEETIEEEYKWLQTILNEELGKIYYNFKKQKFPINEIIWNKGKSWSQETKEKMRQAKINNPTRYWLGKKLPEEMKQKLSLAKIGKTPWNKGRTNLPPSWNKGICMSEEERKTKRKEVCRRYYQKKKQFLKDKKK